MTKISQSWPESYRQKKMLRNITEVNEIQKGAEQVVANNLPIMAAQFNVSSVHCWPCTKKENIRQYTPNQNSNMIKKSIQAEIQLCFLKVEKESFHKD